MEELLEDKIRISKIQEMESPVIIMNPDTLKTFEEKLKTEVIGFAPGKTPMYRDIPIKTNKLMPINRVVIIDDIHFDFTKIKLSL